MVAIFLQRVVAPARLFISAGCGDVHKWPAESGCPYAEAHQEHDCSGKGGAALWMGDRVSREDAERRSSTMGNVSHRHYVSDGGGDTNEEPNYECLDGARIDRIREAVISLGQDP